MHNNRKGLIKKHPVQSLLFNLFCWIMSLCSIYPMFWMLNSSFKSNKEFMLDTMAFPEKFLFSNYPNAIAAGKLFSAAGSSLIYTIINMVLILFFALIAAYFFARKEFKGKKIMYYTYMAGMLIPLYALLVPTFIQYKLLGLINTRWSLIITYYAMCMPLAIILYESYITGIPKDIDESAKIDGCSTMQYLVKILFPLTRPIAATVAILTVLSTWNEFAFATVLTSSLDLRTMSVALRSYDTGQVTNYPYLMAALCVASVPVIAIYLFFSKQVIEGMTAGAVKG